MAKLGNRAANRLVIRFVTAKLKAGTHRLRNRIRGMGASRVAISDITHVVIKAGGGGMGVVSALERRRPRHPHPEASQGGVRKGSVTGKVLPLSLLFRDSVSRLGCS